MKMSAKLKAVLLCAFFAAAVLSGCSDEAASDKISAARTETPSQAVSVDEQNADGVSDGEVLTDDQTEKIMLGDFTAQTLDGDAFTQENIAEYDLTIINFWGTTCPPCINEMPDIAQYQQKLESEDSNVALITFCLDGTTSRQTCEAILDSSNYTGITLVSADGVLGDLAASVMYIPTTVFVYSDGEAAASIIGAQTDIEKVYGENAELLLGNKN